MPIDYTKRRPEPARRAGVSLSKVTLTKSAPTVSLSKQQGGNAAASSGQPELELPARRAASSSGRPPGIDLDLGCLYEFTDGTKGVVQALGNSFTSRNDGAPIICLDGDDRTGENTEGENLRIDLSRLREIRRILVFAYIYEGTPNWAGASAVVTLYPQGGAPIEIHLDEADPGARTCAIALLESTGTDVSVRREVRYVHGTQSALDAAYGWGMSWTKGRK